MNDEREFFYIAELASGELDYIGDYYETAKKDKIFNLQLRYWAEALAKFQKLYDDNFILDEALIIINCLCGSLETLAGVNIKPVEHTPSLVRMYEVTLKLDKGWDLKVENADLFEKLKEMDNYHKNICKHINKGNFRREMLGEINYRKIKEYMGVTQEIWLWVLNKAFSNKIPENQIVFFRNGF